ncbi:MAG: sulfite exporter TauE/SafE family protein [Bacteriovorax sp.]|nr:sulfite exporter TauE/SafE family protein [Bacteriovorax sp.]
MDNYLLTFMGFLTGLIDSVVGGGGLISLPTLSIALSPGPHAIGTNKIVGVTGAAVALFVYARKGHLLWREGLTFCLICAVGSFLGSSIGPHILSKDFFRYLMITMCPVILWIVWNKERFSKEHENFVKPNFALFFITAFLSGFYDGFFGPGGGTFMFLSLFLVNGFPLLQSIAISKLANTFSAGTALVTYAHNGYVHWKIGAITSIGMVIGSYIGATHATKFATKVIRPMLIFVVVLLMVKLIWF